ncbi:MAG: aldehyde dehydrogenase family protein [Ilumatobacteraceae bacterium]
MTPQPLLRAGDRVLVGATLVEVDQDLAAALRPGDRVLGVASLGILRVVPSAVARLVDEAVSAARDAFFEMSRIDHTAVTRFFELAAARLADDVLFTPIAAANADDVAAAAARGRSTTRLELSQEMRRDMIESLRLWRDMPTESGPRERIVHDGWTVEEWTAPLGVVGFVFEGRPNVFADATGVLRSGNTVVFRIGSDALGTARAIMQNVVRPALADAGLPVGAVVLIESQEHAAGWALFADDRLALAVARGSGSAVAELGSIARQSGVPVSLHGTGGAWMIVGHDADIARVSQVIEHSLDRKVCNTLNVVCLPRTRADELAGVVVAAADRAAARRGLNARFHGVGQAAELLRRHAPGETEVTRAHGTVVEARVSECSESDLAVEHEWEQNPEVSVVLVDGINHAVELFNAWSPRFVASVVTGSDTERDDAFAALDAPFIGDGFTRWVDGQFALLRPELGLSNWQTGRLFARGGVLAGDSVYTVRLRVNQSDPGLRR